MRAPYARRCHDERQEARRVTEMRQNGGQQPAVMQSTCISVRTGSDWQMLSLRTQVRKI